MKHSILVLVFLTAFLTAPFAQTTDGLQQEGNFQVHQVKAGETIFSISKAYAIDQKDLLNANPDLIFGLKAGQELKIPVKTTVPEATPSDQVRQQEPVFVSYKVKKKNTLHFIAKEYGVSVDDILRYNPEARAGLKAGQILRIPVVAGSAGSVRSEGSEQKITESQENRLVHRVVGGETLYSISGKYNCSISSILDLNPEARNGLRIGMELKIPSGGVREHSEEVTPGEGSFYYQVESGDTFWGLEKKYQTTKAELIELNPALKDGLRTGLNIRIPLRSVPEFQVVPANEQAFLKHIAAKGETLYSISKRFDVKISELKRVNPVLNYRGLAAGDTILIPRKNEKQIPVEPEFGQEESEDSQDYSVEIHSPHLFADCQPNIQAARETYRVGLMLPLYLPANDSLNRYQPVSAESLTGVEPRRADKTIYARSENFLHFYEGVLLAVDSLQEAGMQVQLHVFDTNQSARTIDSLLRLPVFRELDLIIGPVFPELQGPVVDFANRHQIPMVSPLSASGTFENSNPYYFKINPTKDYLIRKTADYIAEEFVDKNLIVMQMGEYKHLPEAELVNLCREKFFLSGYNHQSSQVLFHEYNFAVEGTWGLTRILSKDQENVFIIPSETEAQVSVAVTNLNAVAENYPVTLVGLSNFPRYRSIQTEYFHQTNLNVLSPYFVDYRSGTVNRFIRKFRQSYYTEPNQFSYQGYDVAFYFMSALFKYGKDFIGCLPSHQISLTQSEFSFDRVSRDGGYMNKGLFIMEYDKAFNIHSKGVVGKNTGYLTGE
ncbi:LysM peptidoglycan-binding domain-containing protein [Gaoshiqia sp. Z1-71]|uniref:LysM peptidoglycan-binding domain-containing protein n=1 Tax=Gaoshiqia hydrogeniformans TaxID=3290090 RepID=UPI003BF878C5